MNHSDLEIRAGNWLIRRDPKFPYVPGLEVVGDVVEVADGVEGIRTGDRVWTMMQGFGGVRAERNGGYAEQLDAWSLLDALTITGYSTEDLDGDDLRTATRALLALRLPAVPHTVLPLGEAARAHALLERRELKGRVVLVP